MSRHRRRIDCPVYAVVGDSCRLTVTHDQLREGANNGLYGGSADDSLETKTLLETGEQLTTPASLRFAESGDQAA